MIVVFNDLDIHLFNLQWCFEKCWEYGKRSCLNPKKTCFDGIFGDNPRVYRFQGGKLLDPKKVEAIVKMPMPKNLHDIQVFNGMA